MSRTRSLADRWTYSEYARLPDDGNRYEVIDGEVCMTPSPGTLHQRVAGNLYFALRPYIKEHHLGELIWDIDLLFVSGQYLRPDMLYVPKRALGGVTDRGVESAPDLVVEVLSPHSGPIDREKKPPRYREFGVPEYWVVDPAEKVVEVYRWRSVAGPDVYRDVLTWRPDPGVPALEVQLEPILEV